MLDRAEAASKAFLSFNSRDELVMYAIAQELRVLEIDVWVANERIYGGQFYAGPIEDAIRACDVLLVLASRHSVGNPGSDHVKTEIALATHGSKRIIPLALDSTLPEKQLGAGFYYQLIRAQYIDLRDAVRTGRYTEWCKLISATIREEACVPAPQLRARELELAESQLAQGQWLQARETLMVHGLRGADLQRSKFLQIVAQLQGAAPLHRLPMSAADTFVAHLNALRGTDEEPAALYVLAVLSCFYYEFNALRDPTGGVASLKRAARASGRLKARTLDAVGPLLPKRRVFELEWRRPD